MGGETIMRKMTKHDMKKINNVITKINNFFGGAKKLIFKAPMKKKNILKLMIMS